MRECGWSGKSD